MVYATGSESGIAWKNRGRGRQGGETRRLGAGEEFRRRTRESSAHEFTIPHTRQHKSSSPLTHQKLFVTCWSTKLDRFRTLFGVSECWVLLLNGCRWEKAWGHPVKSGLHGTVLEGQKSCHPRAGLAELAAPSRTVPSRHASASTACCQKRPSAFESLIPVRGPWLPQTESVLAFSPVLPLYFHGNVIAVWAV